MLFRSSDTDTLEGQASAMSAEASQTSKDFSLGVANQSNIQDCLLYTSGTGLAQLNKKVVMIDTDIGLRNLDVVMGLENRIVYNLVDVVEGKCLSLIHILQLAKLNLSFPRRNYYETKKYTGRQ